MIIRNRTTKTLETYTQWPHTERRHHKDYTAMRTAVVILNWNGRTMLERFMPSVVQHTQADQIQYGAFVP